MTSSLIGRAHPAELLRAEVTGLLAGHGGLALVTGEAGIGKTSLVGEVAAEARGRGAEVLSGACFDGGGAPGYWPWVQVARGLARSAGTARWSAATAAAGGDLRPLLGESPLPSSELPSQLEPGAGSGADLGGNRFRLHDAFTTLLVGAARDRPILVVLEDLHWADPASLRLLDFVVRHAWFEPVLVVGTYRDVELEAPDHPLRPLLEPVLSRATRIALGGLAADEVTALIARTTGAEPDAAQAEAVYRRTGGNPFFVEQTARLGPAYWSGGPGVDAGAPIAVGVRDAVARRLALLPADLVELLAATSAIGHRFDTALAGEVLGVPPAELDPRLEPAVRARLVTRVGAGRYAFVHDLVRESLYLATPEPDRRARHAAIVRALARGTGAGAGTTGVPAGLLGHHAELAVPVLPPAEAAAHLLAAARDAAARWAAEESVRHFRAALALLDADGGADRDADRGADQGVREGVLLELADQLDRAGEIDAARRTFGAVTEAGRARGDAVLVARAALGQHRLGNPEPTGPAQVELLDDARRRLAEACVPDVALTARVLAAAAMARTHQALGRDEAVRLSGEAVRLAREGGDDETLGWCLLAHHDVEWRPGGAADRVTLLDELTEVARRARNLELESLASFLRAAALLEQGLPAAYREFEAFDALAERTRLPRHRYLALTRRGTFAQLHGDFAVAKAHYDDALAFGAEVGEVDRLPMWRDQTWALAMQRGDVPGALATARHLSYPGDPYSGFLVGLTDARRDDPGAARRVLGAIEAHLAKMSPLFVPAWQVFRARLAALTGDEHACLRVRADLAPMADGWAVYSAGVLVAGPVAHWLAVLDCALGRWDAAVAGFGLAVESAERLGARPWAVLARARLAGALRSRHAAGDLARADAVYAEAARAAAELGMTAALDRETTESGTPESGTSESGTSESGTSESGTAGGDAVFQLVGQVWTIRFGGREAHVPDAKGLRDLRTLLGRPGVDVPALELLNPLGDAVLARSKGLGADPMLDERARAAYRDRLRVLDGLLRDALNSQHDRRAIELDREREALLDELRAAAGLGGRTRRLGDQTERARQTVTARIRDTLRRLRTTHPELAEHLAASISTGAHCRYRPDRPIAWTF